MNANAEINAENAESPIEKLNGLIFDLGDTIPEGIYLEMMNHSKKIYDEINKMKQQPQQQPLMIENNEIRIVNHILNREPKIYKLRRITREQTEAGTYYIRLYQNNNLLVAERTMKEGDLLRLFSEGEGYKFIRLVKINEKSIKYNIFHYNSGDGLRYKKDNITLKFKDGNYYEDLTTKNILFYNLSNSICLSLYNRINDGNQIENNNLNITL